MLDNVCTCQLVIAVHAAHDSAYSAAPLPAIVRLGLTTMYYMLSFPPTVKILFVTGATSFAVLLGWAAGISPYITVGLMFALCSIVYYRELEEQENRYVCTNFLTC